MHKQPKKIDYLEWAITLLVLLAILGFFLGRSPIAKAHSWYDADCCSSADCEPVTAITFVAADEKTIPTMIVTTSLGTKPLTPQTKIRQSKDGQMHGCIYQGALICLYMPPGN